MEIQCRDGLSGQSQCLELSCETASQLLTQVRALFEREEEDAALEVDGEVVWVAGWDAADDVAVSSLSLSGDVVLRRSLDRVLSLARDRTKLGGADGDSDLPSWAWEERSVVMAAVRTDGRSLRHASVTWRNDREVVLEAVRESGFALQYAGDFRNDREVVLAAVRESGFALQYAGDFRNDREAVLEAVRQSGDALQYAGEIRNDREIVLEAVRESGFVLEYAGEFRNDREIVLEAVRESGNALAYAGDFRNDREIVLAAVRAQPFGRSGSAGSTARSSVISSEMLW